MGAAAVPLYHPNKVTYLLLVPGGEFIRCHGAGLQKQAKDPDRVESYPVMVVRRCARFHGALANVDEKLSVMEPSNHPPPSPKLRGSVGSGDTRGTRPLLVRQLRSTAFFYRWKTQPNKGAKSPWTFSSKNFLKVVPYAFHFIMEAFKGLNIKHIRLKGA